MTLEEKLRETLEVCDGDVEAAKQLRAEQRELEWEEWRKENLKKIRGEV